MKLLNGKVILNDAQGLSPSLSEVSSYTDTEGNGVIIPNALIVRFYEILKHDAKRKNLDFDEWKNNLFNK